MVRTRKSARLLAAVLFLIAFPTAARAAPTITEHNGGLTVNPWLADITAGPDGNVWFTEGQAGGRIGRITPSGTITEFSAGLTKPPVGIAAGPDGNLWFTANIGGDRIGRITPSGTITEFTAGLTANSQPTSIAAGPDGNLWFTESNSGAIGRITPAGVITEFTSGLTPASQPLDIAAGPDGALWFTQSANPGRIGRITTAGVVTEYSAGLTPNSQPNQITAGPDEALWFTERNNPGRIGRISTSGTITEYSTGLTLNGQPRGIAAGPDGSVWFTEQSNPGAIGRISPTGAITEFPTPSANSAPWHIALGADNRMWFTESANPGAIGQITAGPWVGAASATTASVSAGVAAEVNANGQPTSYWFEYGLTSSYGSQTAASPAGGDGATHTFTADIGGLTPSTAYHVRAVALNDTGITYGSGTTFATGPGSPASDPPPQESPAAPRPQPRLGRTFVVGVVSGTVRIRVPGAARFIAAGALTSLPVGSLVDARRGRVELTTALPGGLVQTGTFWGARFQVLQPRGTTGMTELALRGRLACGRSGVNSSSPRGREVKLWGKDRGGRFRTRGRHSSATVRGTRWLTVDRCDGTLTRVAEGRVVVRDRATGRRILLRAGQSHLARPPAVSARRR